MSEAKQEYGEFEGLETSVLSSSARFEVLYPLGEGGMGRVYLVHDRKTDSRVALKTLTRVNPANLYRFKKEFRSLANVSHPNLVVLHELISERDQWFLTMEYVEGKEFLEHVHGSASQSAPTLDTDSQATQPSRLHPRPSLSPLRSGTVPRLTAQVEARLRAAFAQLALGVQALHDAGKLHKDLKPSNVLVTDDGRVVLLDFGMVDDAVQSDSRQTIDDAVFGTPAYMAPEQASAEPHSGEASDWYSFGAMLYEALTGQLPIEGTALEIIAHKQLHDPPPPSALVANVPADLESLCMELLRRDPAARPGGAEVLARMRPSAPPPPPVTKAAPDAERAPFVGRERELRQLRDAFDATTRGKPAVVLVEGPSGIGKSALVGELARQVRARGDAVVLQGRCYERESVPFKAIDSLIDSLVRHLQHLPPGEAAALLPRDAHALARMFPVLSKVSAFKRAPSRRHARDLTELRRRGFGALKELLARIADRHPLLVCIDDLQWGDADSAALLSHVLGAPDPAAMLLLATYRRDAGGELQDPDLLPGGDGELALRHMELGPLSGGEARDLAAAQLGRDGTGPRAVLEEIARESGGSPFFVGELVRSFARRRSSGAPPAPITLQDALGERIGALADGPRALLEMVAVAGRPLPQRLALRAAELPPEQSTHWNTLRTAHLVHTQGTGADEDVECLHQRVREVVVDRLDAAALRQCHRQLAAALEGEVGADPETLAFHWEQAGDPGRAAAHVRSAAAEANRALAFDRAASLYRRLLRITDVGARERSELEHALGDALANAGHGAEAAAAYLRARELAPRGEGLELERLAAEHFLRSGHVEEGLESLERVLSTVGMSLPTTPLRSLISLMLRRGRLRLRGLRFQERELEDVPADLLIRIDTCWCASSGLGLIDFIRGGDFQTRHLLYALEAGEPARVVRALALEAGYLAAGGSRTQKQTARVVELARELSEEVGDPHAQGLTHLATGMARWHLGHWRESLEHCARGEKVFRSRCAGVAWELATTHVFTSAAHYWLGDLRALAKDRAEHLREARQTGDLFAATDLETGYHALVRLLNDAPDEARAAVQRERERWSRKGFHLQHWNQLEADSLIDLYDGEGERAHARLQERWRELRRSLVLEVQVLQIEAYQLLAHTALAAAAGRTRQRGPLLASARRANRRMRAVGRPWADGLAWVVEGAIRELQGDVDGACHGFERAVEQLETTEMALHAACARYRLGRLAGGDTGDELMQRGARYIADQGALRPERIVATLAPGF